MAELENYTEYRWLIVLGFFACFFMAYGIGANDVANAFATAVGSKALTLRQACALAAVFEFAGAMTLGGAVADTVRGKIADLSKFQREPEIYMFGMFCALISAGTWLMISCYTEIPVSTTHSIVGSIIGFSIAYKGKDAVIWYEKSDSFPFMKGFVPIVVSWFFSPTACAITAFCFFFLVRTFILRAKDPVGRTIVFFPLLVFACIFINLFFVLVKGAGKDLSKEGGLWDKTVIKDKKPKVEVNDANCAWLAAVIAAGVAAIVGGSTMPFLRKWVNADLERAKNAPSAEEVKLAKSEAGAKADLEAQQGGFLSQFIHKAKKAVLYGTEQDVHESIQTDAAAANLHDSAERFDPAAEAAFRYLQIFSSCCDSFSHGANDVANSIGPFAAMWSVYTTSVLADKSETPKWILALGGFGIVVGLATMGYQIIRAIGVKLVVITPARGFCIEVASALVVTLASAYGMPVSTTHCQVGATWGCGILEGKSGINWKSSALIFGGWLTTCVIAGTFTGIIFSLGAYAPSVQEGREIERYEDGLKALMLSMAKDMKAAAASKPGVVATLDAKYLSSDKTSAMPVNSWYKGKYTKSDGKSSDWKTPYGGKYIFKATQSATETMQYMNDLVQLMKENDITI